MIKKAVITHNGMSQDLAQSKFQNTKYFEAENIRVTVLNDQSGHTVTNSNGNELLLTIPEISFDFEESKILYGNKELRYTTEEIPNTYENVEDLTGSVIIGNCRTSEGFVIFTTNNNGLDAVWYLKDDFDLTLLYLRNMGFSTSKPVSCINNKENNKIDKVYFINGDSQIMFLNIYHSVKNGDLEELIDIPLVSISIVSEVEFSNPKITDILYGGTHTSGMIQYAYSYYKINGSESSMSPLSHIIPLGKSETKGGDPNEIVGTIPKIEIDNLDQRFTNIRIYSIKYTSYEGIPQISLIADRNIIDQDSITYYDDGRVVQDIGLEEFLFLQGRVVIPKHIESKDSRLFLFNYKERNYNLTLEDNNLDVRAYSFPRESTSTEVYSNITSWEKDEDTGEPIITGDSVTITSDHIDGTSFLDPTHPAINGNYDDNIYQFDSPTIGGEGPFLKYQIIRQPENKNEIYDYRFFKDEELYRIGIQFFNKFGIKSTPMWIADFVVPIWGINGSQNNLDGNYAGIEITFKPSFFVWLNTSSNFLNEDGVYDDFLKPVGFQLLRADRQLSDRTILAQGIVNSMIATHRDWGWDESEEVAQNRTHQGIKVPSFMRRFDDFLCPMKGVKNYRRMDDNPISHSPTCKPGAYNREVYQPKSRGDKKSSMYQMTSIMQMYSPEVTFEIVNDISAKNLKVIGGLRNNGNNIKARLENYEIALFGDFSYGENVISFLDQRSLTQAIPTSSGLFGAVSTHRGDRDRPNSGTYQLFRDYSGRFHRNTNENIYTIWNKPELSESGAKSKAYNNDPNFIYANNLTTITTGLADHGWDNQDNVNISRVVSNGTRCFTFVLGDDLTPITERVTLEDLLENSSFKNNVDHDSGGLPIRIVIQDIVSTYEDLVNYGPFNGQRIGVLQQELIYFDNDLENPEVPYSFSNVNWIFNTLQDYIDFAEAKDDEDNLINLIEGDLITIKESQYETLIFEVIDQEMGIDGLEETGDTFNYLQPQDPEEINQMVENYSELLSINFGGSEGSEGTIPTGYNVFVREDNIVYTWTGTKWEATDITPPALIGYPGGVGIVVEFRNDENLKYLGNYYGGNSYEAKKNTVYVIASKYFPLTGSTFKIEDPGDTFVQTYVLNRIFKNEETPTRHFLNVNEIIKFTAESTVNNNKRNDDSDSDWKDWWRESEGDMHSYNRVYSQSANLIKSQDFSYEIKLNEEYTSGITATHFKNPGETIDSWTKILPNEQMYLEGKYGSINSVVKINDNILTFQDRAVAKIEINPRVQLSADDGQGVFLGKGDILYDYTYLSTESGTLNKWGVIGSQTGAYYYDTLNNSMYRVSDGVDKLSDIKGMKIFFENNISPSIIRKDNHILKEGVTFGYDYKNNDLYFTFHQNENSKTITFSESIQEYVSLLSFKPSFYFNKGDIFLTTDNASTSLYEHKNGIYNIYYGEYHPSSITYHVNPEPYQSCVFDNINFKSEVYLDGNDVWDKTLTHIQAFNEYQQTPLTPLIQGRRGNIRRRFRDWNADIPRDGRNRIRGPWTKLKVQFNNEDNYKFILHDMIISYDS